jgi:hypothetical protein
MNTQYRHLAGATLAALGIMTAGATFAQSPSSYDPADTEPVVVTTTYVAPSSRLIIKGTRSSTMTIPQYVDGTPENIRGLPFDLATLEGTVTIAMHPASLGNPDPPPVPFNLDTGYLGAPLIESRGE